VLLQHVFVTESSDQSAVLLYGADFGLDGLENLIRVLEFHLELCELT
jgi:hypothetical protein